MPKRVSGLSAVSYTHLDVSKRQELGRAAGRFEAVLFALLHTRVAGEEPGLLEDRAHLFAVLEQRAGDAVADGAGLAGNAAARNRAHNVKQQAQPSTYAKLSDVPSDALLEMREHNPEEYKRLYKAEYGMTCEI